MPGLADGDYVYVQDLNEDVWVLLDGPHRHPKVLGLALPALYAGTLKVAGDTIVELTNLSGTFRCDDDEGLIEVDGGLQRMPSASFHLMAVGLTSFQFNPGSRSSYANSHP